MIKVNLEQLQEAAHWVTQAGGPTDPVRLHQEDAGLVISCGPAGHHRRVVIDEVAEDAYDWTIPGRVFADWIATQKGHKVILEPIDQALVVQARGKCRFPLLTAQHRPAPTPDSPGWTVESQALEDALQAVAGHGRTRDDSTRAWEGFARIEPHRVQLGSPYSAAVAALDAAWEDPATGWVQVDPVPLLSALKGRTGPLRVADGPVATFTWEDRALNLATLEPVVPDFAAGLSLHKPSDVTVQLDAAELLVAVKAAAVDSDTVRLRFDDDYVHVETALSSKGGLAAGQAATQVAYTGETARQVLCNVRFLSAALRRVSGTVTVGWKKTEKGPVIITEPGVVVHAVQPIRTT